jgi:hypothetical protein
MTADCNPAGERDAVCEQTTDEDVQEVLFSDHSDEEDSDSSD